MLKSFQITTKLTVISI